MTRPLNPYRWNRLARHAALLLAGVLINPTIYRLLGDSDVRHGLSMALAYASLVYLAVSMVLGPYRVLRKLPNPSSFDLRRDIGIWAALLAILHTAVGLTVHLRGRMWMYFLASLNPPEPQISVFGLANYLGAVAALLFLLLLLISNDFSLRTLGTARWKAIQRWAYVGAALTVAHGVTYQWVEKRHLPWIVLLSSITLAALLPWPR